MEQNEIAQLQKERSDLSCDIAEEIKKRDNFIAKQNKVIDDLYARFDAVEAKLDAVLRNNNQKTK